MNWLASYDREAVRASIEEATGRGLSVEDALPDTLIAAAQSIGLSALDLRMWIHDSPKISWSPRALAHWARRRGLGDPAAPDQPELPICGHCEAEITGDPDAHHCPPNPEFRLGRTLGTTIYRGADRQPCAWVPNDPSLARRIVAALNRKAGAQEP